MISFAYAFRVSRIIATDPGQALERARRRLARSEPGDLESDDDWRSRLESEVGPFDPRWDMEFASLLEPLRANGFAVEDGDVELMIAIYLLVRKLRPERVVETGVARGFSTRVILEGLEANGGSSHLWSIDLPLQKDEAVGQSAIAVTDRTRWTYILGPSRRELPKLLDRVGGIDLFVHDSDHSHRNMSFEFKAAWKALAEGGAVVSDDVNSSRAFQECFEHRVVGALRGKPGSFGVALKL